MDQDLSAAISANLANSDAVVVAKLEALGAAPGVWSGFVAVYQEAEYSVSRRLAGNLSNLPGSRIRVFHPIVARSCTASESAPQLNETLFVPGRQLVLFLRRLDSRLETFDENCGVLHATSDVVSMIGTLQKK